MDDRGRVAAIRAGDARGLASAYDAYADALFAFCQSMLRSQQGAEDAVQDTFIVLAERVGQLRDPDRLRPWLYAVARTQCLHQLRAAKRVTPTDEVGDVMDESVDLDADLHSAQLQDLVWQAAQGLNTGERAALELFLRHGLEGADLAAALGVSRGTGNKLLQRARDELERGLTALLVARANEHQCAELATVVAGWDGRLTVLMRKRISRHIEGCADCGAQKRHRVSAAALLGAIPLLAAPAALRKRVIESAAMRDVSYNRAALRRTGWFDRAGFPTDRAPHRRAVAAALAAACAVVIGVLLAVVPAHAHRAGFLALATDLPSSAASVPVATSSAPSSSRPATHPATRPASSATLPAQTFTPSSGPSLAHSAPKPPPPSAPSSASTAPASLSVVPSKVDLSTGKGDVTVLATNGTVTWLAKSPKYIGVSPATATLSAGKSGAVQLFLTGAYPKSGASTVYFTWKGGSAAVTVSWST